MKSDEEIAAQVHGQHGKLYWFLQHVWQRSGKFLRSHRKKIALGILAACIMVFLLRAAIHPYVIVVRTHFVMFLLPLVATLLLFWFLKKYRSWGAKGVMLILYLACGAATFLWGEDTHTYMSLYLRYRSLHIVDLKEMPETDKERIHPLNSIHSLAYEAMSETEAPALPDFVRIGQEYRWALAIEPAYPLPRMSNGIRELFSVSGTGPYPSFSKENRIRVCFEVGENLLLGRNSRVATIKTFGVRRYFNYEPADVTYITDSSGNWVQVVSLIRWKGIFFPRPEFGGIQLITQNCHLTILNTLHRMFLGSGKWIQPRQILAHPFLVGQNILSQQVSRYTAASFRFQHGFFAPMPGFHRGDIRIPDLPLDVNDQPFATFFRAFADMPGMLHHYFGLEPYDPDKQGLAASILVPADGLPRVFVKWHHQEGESLIGASAVASKIMEKRKEYLWGKVIHPAEHRPFVRKILGKVRYFVLTTVVTFKDEIHGEANQRLRKKEQRFIAGSVPEIVLTDGQYRMPIWVDPLAQSTWTEQLAKELGPMWKSNE